MTAINANIANERYQVEITSLTGNLLIADEPADQGGLNKGFSPTELLASALGACTCITLRMYADRKSWDLKHITANVELIQESGQTKFIRKLELTGTLDETTAGQAAFHCQCLPHSQHIDQTDKY